MAATTRASAATCPKRTSRWRSRGGSRAPFEARLGLRVLLTRDDDRSVAVDQRTAIANNNKANLFISLHANASPRPGASGASIYVAAFDPDEQTRTDMPSQRLAVFGGGLRELELVPWDLAQTRHVAQSTELATLLEEQLRQRVRARRASDRARQAPCARVREHAGRAHRNGLPHQP